MEWRRIKRDDLVLNSGQIKGVLSNPRSCEYGQLIKLRKSIDECPELFEIRGLIVYPQKGKYVVLCGNSRLIAAGEQYDELPCIVLDKRTSVETLRAYVVKDNSSFGKWDVDAVNANWTMEELESCNIAFDAGASEDVRKKDVKTEDLSVLAVKLTPEEFEFVMKKLQANQQSPEKELLDILGYGA